MRELTDNASDNFSKHAEEVNALLNKQKSILSNGDGHGNGHASGAVHG